ncbi:MAG: Glucose-1-phosphate adenylyltransferase, partial [Chloroflexi bacterium]|nr:Glucose-1-phosphate adenylyltransferase [Chloroflexota bacterium]
HMDLLVDPPPINLNDREWIMHTRTEERPPVRIAQGAQIIDSMITDGCVISAGATVERSVLSAGVRIGPDAIVRESILLTDAEIEAGAQVKRAILDKHVIIRENAHVGAIQTEGEPVMTMIGKHSIVPAGMIVEPGAVIGPDVIPQDYPTAIVRGRDYIQTRRLPYEI